MARPLRLEFAGALYHVTSRGDRREAIYEDDADREAFLELLGKVCTRHNWVCYAYCLMSNHYHLMVETPDANLSRGMRQLNGVYTQAFNRRHARAGHVFMFMEELSEVPAAQRRESAKSLQAYARSAFGRDEGFREAYASGGYTLQEIGRHFGLHYSRVSRIVLQSRLIAKHKT